MATGTTAITEQLHAAIEQMANDPMTGKSARVLEARTLILYGGAILKIESFPLTICSANALAEIAGNLQKTIDHLKSMAEQAGQMARQRAS